MHLVTKGWIIHVPFMMQEEIELLEELTPPLDMAKIHSGDLSPVYFGSAMNNFGVGYILSAWYSFSPQFLF